MTTHAIDCVREEWYTKPVSVALRDGVSISLEDGSVDDSGWPRDSAGAGAAANVLLDRLEWWANAPRSARADRPYMP